MAHDAMGEISTENAHTWTTLGIDPAVRTCMSGLGLAWAQDDSIFAAVFAVEAALAAAEALYHSV